MSKNNLPKYSYDIIEVKQANNEIYYIAKIKELVNIFWFKIYFYISSPYVSWFGKSAFRRRASKFKTIEDAKVGAELAIEKILKEDSETIINEKIIK